tara:strand:- start:2251 stop:3024 length:774 start_codon:yes stop_codon:yes gene_type:complete
MSNFTPTNPLTPNSGKNKEKNPLLNIGLKESREKLQLMKAEERLNWAIKEFDSRFVLTTSFGIQSAVLLNMIHGFGKENSPKVVWVDTGYLPKETYTYAEQLTNQLELEIEIVQSKISPARMEALYGRLWSTNSVEDLEKYNHIRKVEPLEEAFNKLDVICWASGVRGGQTTHRRSMTYLDSIRGRISLRPILEWSKKDIFYYMKENDLPQHPLFEQGYSTVGDWHSSKRDSEETQGRKTRFQGLKEECGIHLPEDT